MQKPAINNNGDTNNNDDGRHEDAHDGTCACCAAAACGATVAVDRNRRRDSGDTETVHSIESILRRHESDESIRLAGIRCEAGSRPGDNYMSVVKRVHAYGTRDSGEGRSCVSVRVSLQDVRVFQNRIENLKEPGRFI